MRCPEAYVRHRQTPKPAAPPPRRRGVAGVRMAAADRRGTGDGWRWRDGKRQGGSRGSAFAWLWPDSRSPHQANDSTPVIILRKFYFSQNHENQPPRSAPEPPRLHAVELLVVIAIIGILAGLLLPVLSVVKQARLHDQGQTGGQRHRHRHSGLRFRLWPVSGFSRAQNQANANAGNAACKTVILLMAAPLPRRPAARPWELWSAAPS